MFSHFDTMTFHDGWMDGWNCYTTYNSIGLHAEVQIKVRFSKFILYTCTQVKKLPRTQK